MDWPARARIEQVGNRARGDAQELGLGGWLGCMDRERHIFGAAPFGCGAQQFGGGGIWCMRREAKADAVLRILTPPLFYLLLALVQKLVCARRVRAEQLIEDDTMEAALDQRAHALPKCAYL